MVLVMPAEQVIPVSLTTESAEVVAPVLQELLVLLGATVAMVDLIQFPAPRNSMPVVVAVAVETELLQKAV
jgi:hypothetical protein